MKIADLCEVFNCWFEVTEITEKGCVYTRFVSDNCPNRLRDCVTYNAEPKEDSDGVIYISVIVD